LWELEKFIPRQIVVVRGLRARTTEIGAPFSSLAMGIARLLLISAESSTGQQIQVNHGLHCEKEPLRSKKRLIH
jgi:hypothetical protein